MATISHSCSYQVVGPLLALGIWAGLKICHILITTAQMSLSEAGGRDTGRLRE